MKRILLLTAAACATAGPHPRPLPPPSTQPSSMPVQPPAPGRRLALARLCGMFVKPIAASEDGRWITDRAALDQQLEHGMMPRFRVVGWRGRGGIFTVAGMTDNGGTGGFAGGGPCDEKDPPECAALYQSCAIVVGPVKPDEDDHPDLGGGCVAGGDLLVDIDGDGKPEAFPAHDLGIAEEIDGVVTAATCTPTGGVPEANVLAIVDLDGDGRRELLVQTAQGWVLYGARQRATHLVRIWGPLSPS